MWYSIIFTFFDIIKHFFSRRKSEREKWCEYKFIDGWSIRINIELSITCVIVLELIEFGISCYYYY
jgi:hypothetical protein